MRNAMLLTLVHILFAGPQCAIACADGGQVRVMQQIGDYQLTVFTSPNPLRAGPVDVSVLVQDAATGQTVPNATITVELTPADPSRPAIRAAATTTAATNKLLRAALVDLPSDGRWNVCVETTTVADQAPFKISFAIEAAPPLPRWLSVWPWFSWPVLAVLIFAIHRTLVNQRAGQARFQQAAAD